MFYILYIFVSNIERKFNSRKYYGITLYIHTKCATYHKIEIQTSNNDHILYNTIAQFPLDISAPMNENLLTMLIGQNKFSQAVTGG